MKRRPFLTSIATIGASAMLPFKSSAVASSTPIVYNSNLVWNKEEKFESKQLVKLENEHLIFTWMSDATAEIKVKKTNTTWKMGPVALQEIDEEIDHGHVWVRQERSICEQLPGRFRGEMNGNKIRFYLLDLQGKTLGTFNAEAKLDHDWVAFEITEIDDKLPNLTFPTPIQNDMLLLPEGVGKLIRTPLQKRLYQTWYAHLNMRFCAGLNKDNNGYLALFEDGFEDSGILAMNMSVMPVWLKSLGKWAPSRKIRYGFTNNGYVGVAHKFRDWAKQHGLIKPLEEKIKETPELAKLVGGRQVSFFQSVPKRAISTRENSLQAISKEEEIKAAENKSPNIIFTHKQVLEIMEEIKKDWGFKKGMINLRGWVNGGYDYSHPDVWPPEPTLGSIEDLKKICATKPNYFSALHDNYMDSYAHNPSFPKGVIIDKRGRLMRGGNWGGGQAYIMQYKTSVEFIKRNWEQIKTLKTAGMFIDTTTAVQLYENYEPNNMLTRADDLKYKVESIKFFKSQKQVYGSEETSDFCTPYADFLETRHSRIAGESVPLWPLVFHDTVMTCRYVDPSNMKLTAKPYLEDMLWGYFVLVRIGSMRSPEWRNQKQAFVDSLPADEWFGQIATTTMTNHEFLSEDYHLERTTFSNGKTITINFAETEKTFEGATYKPLSYKIS